jgi:RHS repeat-associated protein
MKMKMTFLRKLMSTFLMGIFLLSTCIPATLAEEIVHFYHNDHLGSPLAMTDEDGNVVWRRDYKPFGQEIDPGGETTFNTHTYTGKEFDAETGLYYYGARYYDPVIGRFISVDPAGANPSNPQSWNRYVYTLNNPYKYVDPDGEVAIVPILLGIWAVVEVALSAYDAYDTANTVLSPETSSEEKGIAVGLFAVGMVAPGGGYSKIDDAAKLAAKKAAKKPIVIGETMERVKKAARKIDGEYYVPRKSRDKEHLLKKNKRWIRDKMREQREIYDVGPDSARRQPGGKGPSDFYELEKAEIKKKEYPLKPIKID